MRGRKYVHDQAADNRRFSPTRIIIITVVLFSIAVISFVLFNQNQLVQVDVSRNQPIAGTIAGVTTDTIVFDHPSYSLELPTDWIEEERVNTRFVNKVVYISSGQATTGRTLEIYFGENRTLPPITKVLPVVIKEGKIIPGKVSPQCETFTDFTDAALDEPVQGKWERLTFNCSPNKTRNIVGTVEAENQNGFTIETESGGEEEFFIIYTDHSGNPDPALFLETLKSFRAK